MTPRASVIMPTYGQAAFLGRALASLLCQSMAEWELIVVDDGSPDDVVGALRPLRHDPRIRYLRLPRNLGLGAACNAGLDAAAAAAVAYLPSDDRLDPWHLEVLLAALAGGAPLAWSGVRHHGGQVALGPVPGHGLQLVQVAHARTAARWRERGELESDDLDRLYWSRLGAGVGTGVVSCEWVDHPGQRHKAIRESCDGGLNVFRSRYGVPAPLRFRSSDGPFIDEVALYRRFRDRARIPARPDGLKILLVGELAFNPERVLALEERGHRLYGLWTRDGLGDSTVGPLPFGHVEDLPGTGWADAVRRLRPNVIYALLNWRAVPFAHTVLQAGLGVPFVWHFKEAPFHCIARGTWPHLVDLVTQADARVFATTEELEWFELALPGRLGSAPTLVLDGDLPKADWFAAPAAPRPRLSAGDGELHTVVLGRPLGLDAKLVAALAAAGVHTHLHGLVRAPGPKGAWAGWLEEARELAPGHVHVHPHIAADQWMAELSRYDAGWLHHVPSDNAGDLRRASWDDLNAPARVPPLLGAGVPLLQLASPGCRVAAQELVRRTGAGLLYHDADDLAGQLQDEAGMARRRAAALACRAEFTFDHHADRLIDLFREVAR